MFKINENIVKNSLELETYENGLQCYNNGQIESMDVSIDEELNVERIFIEGKVKSFLDKSRKYRVKIVFPNDNNNINCYCDCKEYYTYKAPCKHIASVLIKYTREGNKSGKKSLVNRNSVLIQQLRESLVPSKVKLETKPLNLQYKLQFNIDHSESQAFLELKVGEQKLYVVKNMKNFLEAVVLQNDLEFGKNFTFNSGTHKFKKEDKTIIDILKDVYQVDKAAEEMTRYDYRYNRSPRFLSGKKAHLTENNLKRFLNRIGEVTIDLVINDNNYTEVKVVKENFPLKFKLDTSNENIILSQTSKLPKALLNDGSCFFYDNIIYMPTNEHIEVYRPFYNIFVMQKSSRISFHQSESEEIASYVIPALKKIGSKVLVDKKIKEKFCEEPLKPCLYFDKQSEAVVCDVIFKYGNIEINALKENQSREEKKVLVRDIEGEAAIVDNLTAFHFEKNKSNFILEDEDKILDFIGDGLEKLQELAEIYYSDAFKDIKVYTTRNYKSDIRLNDEDLLEFTFNIDGVDRQELKHIFEALKQKKKYYRLKNGGFIPLQTNELQNMSDMIGYLNVKASDLEKDKIILSKYNAVYIDTNLKENNINFVKRNKNFRELVNNIKDIGDIDYTIPENLDNVMRGYQKFGFKWFKTLSSCGFGGILADEMGLGKTLQAIAFIKSEVEGNDKELPSLVVCPTSLVYNWESEINKFESGLKCIVVSGSKEAREEQLKGIEEFDVVITSYALIKRDIDEYKSVTFRHCFLDEAQNIKNPESLNAQSVKSLKAGGYFALTGTPIENSLTELWSIFDFIMPGYLLNHRKFSQKYEAPIIKSGDKKALKELNKHTKPFILRRLKKDVIEELPPKIEHNMIVDMTEEQKKVYAAYLQHAKEEVSAEIRDRGINKSKIKILSIITRLRQICCDPSTFIENYKSDNGKMEALKDIVKNNVNEGHKILLFSQFTSVLKNIGGMFKSEDIKYMYLDGSIKAEARGELVKGFNDGEIPIFLISLKAGGTGLNLTSADIVIHYDPWWNPAVEEQASDRAHRIGQKKTVEVIRLIAKGTIEEKIYKIQQKKKNIINNVIEENTGEEILLSNMADKDIEELFS
ncbi:SNF2 helicase associated domain-containing protein [Clostridium sp. WILCCON 0269]|uniref:SNF2 helicase associated domain-containing protein n=1 Tax=Candidatus Clostridium eludens TaxID=3381663 RepID=A0ABW8SRD8_9CLOT